MIKILSIGLAAALILNCGTATAQQIGFVRIAPMHEPAPLVPITKLPLAAMHDAIKKAAEEHGWVIVDDQPGRIDAKYDPGREFWIKISITYDPRQIRIAYVDSAGLNYTEEDGQRWIHPNVASWFDNLIASINVYLLRAEPLE